MAKLYWATDQHAERWSACEDREDAIRQARDWGMGIEGDVQVIWIAPVDAELDDDDAFWDALADHLLVWGVESAEETLVEDGWLDHEEAWKSGDMPKDRDRIVARALREVLGPRPEWRTVDTAKAERVDL
jgi:hypothetical protein